jgi:hypothetical protein
MTDGKATENLQKQVRQLGGLAQPVILAALIAQFRSELDRLETFVRAFAAPEVPAAVAAATDSLAEAMGDVAGESQLAREALTATTDLLRQVAETLEALPSMIDRAVSEAVAREVQSAMVVRH